MSYPTSPVFSGIKLRSRNYNVRSESIAGRTQSRSLGGQRWEFSAKYPTLTRAQFQPVFAFAAANAGVGAFEMTPPVISDKSGNASGPVTCNGGSSKGDTTVPLTGLSGTLKAGDVIKFANQTKVYMIVADLAGSGTLTITPPLVTGVVGGEGVTYDSVPFRVRLMEDVQEFTVSPGKFYSYEVDFVESV